MAADVDAWTHKSNEASGVYRGVFQTHDELSTFTDPNIVSPLYRQGVVEERDLVHDVHAATISDVNGSMDRLTNR